MLGDVCVEVVVKTSFGLFAINVWIDVVIDTLRGAYVDVIVSVESDIGVVVLADDVLEDVITVSKFAMTAP